MANLLVIGGTGFFGKSIAYSFRNNLLKKFQIDEIILTGRSIPQNLPKHKEIIFYEYNGATDKNIPDCDYLIYAASTASPEVYSNKNFPLELNIQKKNIDNFYDAISKKNIKKLLYTSSGSVYGQNNLNNYITDESSLCNPTNHTIEKSNYSKIKVMWENFIIQNLSHESIIARCFAFIGLFLPRDKHFVIGNFLQNIIDNEPLKVKSSNKVYRSFMTSDDLADILLRLLTFKLVNDNIIYNVGSDEEIEIHELANELNIQRGYQPTKYTLDDKIDRYVPNISKLKTDVGYEKSCNLIDSIKNTVNLIKKTNEF